MAVVGKQDPVVASARRADRRTFDAEVGFRARHGRATVKVRDISTHGARVAAIHLLRQGDTFFLTIPSLEPIEARVAWADQFELGCEFVRPLHPAVLDTILARLR
jgi:hypothetical protein